MKQDFFSSLYRVVNNYGYDILESKAKLNIKLNRICSKSNEIKFSPKQFNGKIVIE